MSSSDRAFFETTRDLKWLYFDLALKGAFKDWSDAENDLERLVRDTIWGDLRGEQDGVIEQAARYIDRPIFHCTALRDLFIGRLTESLSKRVFDESLAPKPNTKLRLGVRVGVALVALVTSVLLWSYIKSWSAALPWLFLFLAARRWEREYESRAGRWSLRHYQNHYTRDAIRRIVERVTRGGFDELTIIRQLEMYDIKLPRPTPVLTHAGTSFVFTIDDTPIAVNFIIPVAIPDVLYALLRLPRRNVESELSKTFYALSDQEKEDFSLRWRRFVDELNNYDEPRRRATT